MKKFGSFALAALLVAALSVSASAASKSEAAKGTATIDGKKDNVYACDPLVVEIDETSGKKTEKGATGKVWTAWDDKYLYVYAEVVDAKVTDASKVTSLWANDSIEVYVNYAGKDGKIADINAAQITYGPSYTKLAGGGKYQAAHLNDIKTAFTYNDKGYTVELALPWDSFDVKEGATLGFSVGINDDADDKADSREYHTFDGAGLGSAWQTADSNWGTLTLSSKKYEAPKKETAAQTADMGIIAAVASLAASGAAYISLKKRK